MSGCVRVPPIAVEVGGLGGGGRREEEGKQEEKKAEARGRADKAAQISGGRF